MTFAKNLRVDCETSGAQKIKGGLVGRPSEN